MPRFKLYVEYLGTRYRGWQIQKNARTVQGALARAVRAACGSDRFELTGSGRTDAGVHALEQVAHLDLDSPWSPPELCRRINRELPADIHLLGAQRVSRNFHARHDAVARSYLYQISRRRTAFGKALVWWVPEELKVPLLQKGAQLFVGMKDFRSFTAGDPESKSTLVLIEALLVREVDDLILVRVEGSHFLWKMVRRMVAVLVEVGKGALSLGEVERLLHRSSSLPARLTAPPSGLFLERVYYPGDRRLDRLEPVLAIRSRPGMG